MPLTIGATILDDFVKTRCYNLAYFLNFFFNCYLVSPLQKVLTSLDCEQSSDSKPSEETELRYGESAH